MSDPKQPARRPCRRVRSIALAGAGVVAVSAATAAAVGFGGGDDTPATAALSPETATVTRETLRDTHSEPGALGYGTDTGVDNRLTGTVTDMPDTGGTRSRGESLYHLDDDPVVLLYGEVPAWRGLSPGAEGPDVAQLEENLDELGYSGFAVDDVYTSDTAEAVVRWQSDLGLPETGVVELGRVVFAPGQVRVASQAVAVGDALTPGQQVLSWTGTERVVTTELDVADQRLAEPESEVLVILPDGAPVAGAIDDVVTVIEIPDGSGGPGEDEDPRTLLEVTVAVVDPAGIADYDQAAVQVQFTASERADVLTVPVAALLALREGGYGVEVIEGGATRIVPVETGLFAGGRVEVSGEGIAEGTVVGMPS